MAILVTGGAGYIGSVTVKLLQAAGEDVVVLDNLSRGHRPAVGSEIPFYQGDIGDAAMVETVCSEQDIEACVHFAAYASVGESVQNPGLYYANNVQQGIAFTNALLHCEVKKMVFSSTCATYGEPQEMPMSESHPQNPASPYGWNKYMMERFFADCDRAYDFRYVALRYFNASGAIPERGEDHRPESHLLPNILFAALGRIPQLKIFGDDYPTDDGTCVRDYIHVADLAQAHIKALNYLRADNPSDAFNLGTGCGYTVLQCIQTARQVTGKEIPAEVEARRPGDPSHLVANAAKAQAILDWQPEFGELEQIIQSAWDWHCSHPNGYGD